LKNQSRQWTILQFPKGRLRKKKRIKDQEIKSKGQQQQQQNEAAYTDKEEQRQQPQNKQQQ
jgi:hypothetical protein